MKRSSPFRIEISLIVTLIIFSMNSFAQQYNYNNPNYNQKGNLDGLQQKTYNGEIEYEHLYKDGIIQETTNYNITVEDQNTLKGYYKEGEPFNGYFVNPDNSMELNIVDYYEDGVQVAQYSKPINFEENSDIEGDYNSTTHKTNYKNGMIWTGLQYHQYSLKDNAFLLATENYQEGKLKDVDLLIGAVHYAELMQLSFNENGYILSSKEGFERKAGNVTVTFTSPNAGMVSFSSNSKFEFYKASIDKKLQPMGGMVNYYKEGDIYKYQHAGNFKSEERDEMQIGSTIYSVYEGLMDKVPTLNKHIKNDYSTFFKEPQSEFSTKLFLDEDGAPELGTLISPGSEPHTYSYFKYKNGKLTESKVNLAVEEFEELAKFNMVDFIVD